MGRWGGLLRRRVFRLLWIGETVSGTGTAMAMFVIPLLAVSQLRAGTFEVSALTAAAYLPYRARPYLRPLTAQAAAGNLAYSGYTSLAVIFLIKTVGFGSATAGVLMTTTSAGGLVAALAARRLASRFGAIPLGAMIAGALGTTVGIRTALWIVLAGLPFPG